MSNKPRIGTAEHAEAYPERLSLYNANYDPNHVMQVEDYDQPWRVDRGWNTLKEFASFEKALDYMLKLMEVDKCASI